MATTRTVLRVDLDDQRRLENLASVSHSEVSRIARFAVVDALRRLDAAPGEAVNLLKAYTFETPTAERRTFGVLVDDEFRPYVDELIERIMAGTRGTKLTPNKALCVAVITFLRQDDDKILEAIGAPFRRRATWEEPLRSAS